MRRSMLAALLVLAALPASAGAEVGLREVDEFSAPVYATGAPGDHERLYVVEQEGTIEVFRDGGTSDFVDLTAAVRGPGDAGAGGEEGLLSLAFAPDFQTSRLFYVYYTRADGDANRVDELRAPTGDAADPGSRRPVISIPHPGADNHNGGQIQFGPDDMLYIAPGDGGTGGAPARDPNSLLGKLLRIDPRGDAPGEYAIPADNPLVGQPGNDEIWATGLRNPFRFSFDRLTGDLVLGDVGQGTTEEINYLPSSTGRGRGADFGWNVCEGSFLVGSTTQPCSIGGSTLPVIEKRQDDGYQSIIPGYVVRDPSLPSLQGRLVYGDYFVDRPRTAVLGPGGASDDRDVGPQLEIEELSGFGEDAAGCVYAVSRLGPVYRLVENDTQIPCGSPTTTTPPPGPIGGGPSAPGGPGGEQLRDARTGPPPTLVVRVKRRQRVLKLRGAVAYLRCDEQCTVTARGRLRIGKRRFALRPVTSETIDATERARVKPRLTRRAVRALRRALRDGRPASVRLELRARDRDGTQSPLLHRTVIVRR